MSGGAGEACSPLAPPLPARAGEALFWGGLHGSAVALAVAQAACAAPGPLLLVTAAPLTADRLREELGFFLAGRELPLLNFPDWETLPYDCLSPCADIVSGRLETLARLPTLERGIVIVPAATLAHRLAPSGYVASRSLLLERGRRMPLARFRERLERGSYRFVSQVLERGEAAVRGAIVDVFPMGAEFPCRIEWLDEEIESLRFFDPETQLSLRRTDALRILPGLEFPVDEGARTGFRTRWRQAFSGNPLDYRLYREVGEGRLPAGIQYYLPLFHPRLGSLWDYLPDNTLAVFEEEALAAAERFWQDAGDRYRARRDGERDSPPLPPESLFLSPDELTARLDGLARVEFRAMAREPREGAVNFGTRLPEPVPVTAGGGPPLALLRNFLADFPGRVLLAAATPGMAAELSELLSRAGTPPRQREGWDQFLAGDERLGILVAPLEHGLRLESQPLAVLGERQLFGERARRRRTRRAARRVAPEEDLHGLAEMTPVVHDDYGVGRYRGLVVLEPHGVPAEFICLEYAGGDRLYVSVASLNRLHRYTGADPEHAPLHKLGGKQWQRARGRALRQIRDSAAELLAQHARRAAVTGRVFTVDTDRYAAFCRGFPFEETADQEDAISKVLDDMQQPRPMDRLLAGDSGFGKTEVALRAAFVAVDNGCQVAVLAPTTLLVQQHYRNFRDRFADWPVRVARLSRFSGGAGARETLAGLADGAVDIVIGTHKLLQDRVRYRRLGLVILDEEHRFGVRQKERLRAVRADADVLSLTATPIPRTLDMALSGIREFSVLSTAPAHRLPVCTMVREWDDSLLREAILRELRRGGQIYFVHNRIETIDRAAERVAALVPDCELRVAHGRLPEAQLERIMLDFYRRRFQLLVCTTIVENGIDVPTANTLIVDRAHRMGLAQLYQLRGRVGRSHHNAYAYMLIPPRKVLPGDALRRLEAIESLDSLGIGFTLAVHDLEIRGAGALLGEEQSGHIAQIGYGSYMELLRGAVADQRCGRGAPPDFRAPGGTEVELRVAALLPEDYMPDIQLRLAFYKRISGAADDAELANLRAELIDRFGTLPEPAENLLRIGSLRRRAESLGLRRVELNRVGGSVSFRAPDARDISRLIRLVQQEPQRYRLAGDGERLRITTDLSSPRARLHCFSDLLDRLCPPPAA
ncbi:MAG: transcription-repair coupling factor [Gammaproteobacteria bacterium]|nr:transcription-repair coupling factor [Gammaproteobacteria bacterium]